MVHAISTKYGTATRPADEISFPTNELFRSTQKVIARWEVFAESATINLVRSTFLNSFALVMFSKGLDAQADAAIAKSIKLRVKRIHRKKSTAREKRPMTSKQRDRRTGRFFGRSVG